MVVNNLLSSGFTRLFKNRLFWTAEIFMVGLAALLIINNYTTNLKYPDRATHAENYLLADGVFTMFVIAVFVSIFIGTEYSDGTVRNKIVTGHSRVSIYFSNFIVCNVFSFIMKISYMAVILGLGIPVLGSYDGGITPYIVRALFNFAALVAVTSVILLVSMMIQSKSAGSVTALILTLVCLCFTTYIHSRLSQPEYYDEELYLDENGFIQTIPSEPNPYYISGRTRTVYEFIDDCSPYSQLFFIGSTESENINLYPLYSLTFIVLTTGCGVLVFRKKNLR